MCQLFCLLFDAVSTIEDRLQINIDSFQVKESIGQNAEGPSLEETFAAASFSHFDFSLFSTSCVIESAAIDAGGWWRRVARVGCLPPFHAVLVGHYYSLNVGGI